MRQVTKELINILRANACHDPSFVDAGVDDYVTSLRDIANALEKIHLKDDGPTAGESSGIQGDFDAIENVFNWNDLLDEATSTSHDLLFRADVKIIAGLEEYGHRKNIIADMWAEDADPDVPFDEEFRHTVDMSQFFDMLQKHLNKIQQPCQSWFVSTTPNFEWALHRTIQKSRSNSPFHVSGVAGLAVINAKAIHSNGNGSLLEVAKLIQFAERIDKSSIFSQQLRDWADNCREHISINAIPSAAILRWIPHTELTLPGPHSDSLIHNSFAYSYTLGHWRQQSNIITISLAEFAGRVARLALSVSGTDKQKGISVGKAIQLVVSSSDWGYQCLRSEVQVTKAAKAYARFLDVVGEAED